MQCEFSVISYYVSKVTYTQNMCNSKTMNILLNKISLVILLLNTKYINYLTSTEYYVQFKELNVL